MKKWTLITKIIDYDKNKQCPRYYTPTNLRVIRGHFCHPAMFKSKGKTAQNTKTNANGSEGYNLVKKTTGYSILYKHRFVKF